MWWPLCETADRVLLSAPNLVPEPTIRVLSGIRFDVFWEAPQSNTGRITKYIVRAYYTANATTPAFEISTTDGTVQRGWFNMNSGISANQAHYIHMSFTMVKCVIMGGVFYGVGQPQRHQWHTVNLLWTRQLWLPRDVLHTSSWTEFHCRLVLCLLRFTLSGFWISWCSVLGFRVEL